MTEPPASASAEPSAASAEASAPSEAPSIAPTAAPTSAAPTAAPSLNPAAAALLEHIPEEIRDSCAEEVRPYANLALACTAEDVRVVYMAFDDKAAADETYEEQFASFARSAGPGIATCEEGPYEREYPDGGTQSGLIVCFERARQPNVVWTDDELAILAQASSNTLSLTRLHEWWQDNVSPLP
ncbi:MAG: hypothetical protein H0X16_11355 [Chloroflexi bacterium]|nr:hypothetical protein [Chloroflexota bacterium]